MSARKKGRPAHNKGRPGRKWTRDERAAHSQRLKERTRSPLEQAKRSAGLEAAWAKRSLAERRERMNRIRPKVSSLKGRSRVLTPEHLANLSRANARKIGTKRSAESRLKMSLAHKGRSHKGRPHSMAARRAMSLARKGVPKPAQHRERMSKAQSSRWAAMSPAERQRISNLGLRAIAQQWASLSPTEQEIKMASLTKASRTTRPTSIERIVSTVLDAIGIAYSSQHQVGRYVVDFFVPSKSLVIEADGDYWHSLPERRVKDEQRDAYLRLSGYTVLRITEAAIKAGQFDTLRQAVG